MVRVLTDLLLEVDRPISAHILSVDAVEVMGESSQTFNEALESLFPGLLRVISPVSF